MRAAAPLRTAAGALLILGGYLVPALAAPAAAGGEPAPRYETAPLLLEGAVERLLPADLDGDGLLELVCAREGRLDVHFQKRGAPFFFGAPDASLTFAERAVGWCVAPLARGETAQVVALLGGTEVKRWPLDPAARKFQEPKPVRAGIPGLLPRGFHYLPFLRDVDRDGVGDLVVPGPSTFRVYLLKREGGISTELEVPEKIGIRSHLRAENLTDQVGQSVSIPLFDLRDVNADGRVDLVSETDDRLEAFLAAADGTYPRTPSYALDLAAARDQLGEFNLEEIDWSNLTAALARTVQVAAADVNGDGIEDLVLRAGGKVSLFLGGKRGLDTAHPQQVLKSSGNVVFAAISDEDGDRRPDLWLVRLEAIGVGDVFLWLIASGKLGIDIFIYRSTGERFASRPSRRLEITVRFPSIISLIRQVEEMEAFFEGRSSVLRRAGDLLGRGKGEDAVVIDKGVLKAYLGKAAARPFAGKPTVDDVLRLVGYRVDQDRYELDLTNLKDFVVRMEGLSNPRDLDGPPDLEIPLAGAPSAPGLWLLDLNGDRRDDFLLIYEHTAAALRGVILLSTK